MGFGFILFLLRDPSATLCQRLPMLPRSFTISPIQLASAPTKGIQLQESSYTGDKDDVLEDKYYYSR